MRSHLLEGTVRHRRARPLSYGLEHSVWYAALDLAELPELDRRLRLFGHDRRAVAEFRDRDHLPVPSRDLDADVRAHLRAAGVDPTDWRITLVTNLRVFGYVFNPASFFLCRDPEGVLRVDLTEVHNTFGERHLYTLRRVFEDGTAAGSFSAGMDKDFFVSPFISVDGRYGVHVRDEAEGLRLAISLRQDGEILLSTSLVLRRLSLTDRDLVRMLLRHPFVTHKTIALIHYHALRLWLKGAPFFRHGVGAGATTSARAGETVLARQANR